MSGTAPADVSGTKLGDLNAYLSGIQARLAALLQTDAMLLTAASFVYTVSSRLPETLPRHVPFPVFLAGFALVLSMIGVLNQAGLSPDLRTALVKRLMTRVNAAPAPDRDAVDRDLHAVLMREFHSKHNALRVGRIALGAAITAGATYILTIVIVYYAILHFREQWDAYLGSAPPELLINIVMLAEMMLIAGLWTKRRHWDARSDLEREFLHIDEVFQFPAEWRVASVIGEPRQRRPAKFADRQVAAVRMQEPSNLGRR